MKQVRTLGCIAVFVAGLLFNLTSVYAFHFVAGGGIYSLTSNGSETSVQFQFLGVKSIPPPGELAIPLIPTTIQCTVVHKGESMSFRLFTSGTELDPFTVTELDLDSPRPRRVTLTGEMLSRIVLGVGSNNWHFPEIAHTEIAHFEAVGMDVAEPGAGRDSFTLTIDYSASKDIGPLLFKTLGPELVNCTANVDICTLTLTGTVNGEVEGHTASGD
jgi:hypothetical protein